MILDSFHSYIGIWVCSFLFSRVHRFALTDRILHQSAQFGFLYVSAGNVLGQVEPVIRVYFRVRQLPKP